MKVEEKKLALKLRLEQQLSLAQISKITGLSKSTLSLQLRDYPLSVERINELKIPAQMIGAKANKDKADIRKFQYRLDGVELFNSNQGFRDLTFLYWGEGSKYKGVNSFQISNTDPHMIQYIIKVLTDIGYFDKIVATSYCYEHTDLDAIKQYWYKYVGKDIRTYVVKNSNASKLKRVDKQPNGTMQIYVGSIELLHNILGALDQIKSGSLAQR